MKKILIIQNKFLGDVLTSTLIADAVKFIDTTIQVDFFCYSNALPLLENHPSIDNIIHVKEKDLKILSVLKDFIFLIRKNKYDAIFDPYAKFQSQLMTLFSGAKKTISYNTGYKTLLYKKTIPLLDKPIFASCTAIEEKLQMVQTIFPTYKIVEKPYQIVLSDEQINKGLKLLHSIKGIDKNLPTVMFGIMGSNDSKSYPWKYMVKLIENLLQSEQKTNIIFNYTPNQSEIADFIYEALKKPSRVYPKLVGNDLRDMLSVLCHCKAVLGCEGGLIHMAKAMKKPTFTIYSPNHFKNNWAAFENLDQNQSVHLIDFKPDLFKDNQIENNEVLYSKFLPEFIIPKLTTFKQKYIGK